MRPEISVVLACRNEEANVEAIAAAVISELQTVCESFELIFIDNQSSDRTVEIVKGMCARDPRIKLIVNTRNFGQMRSPTHGIYAASGDAVISMCSDFQDSPALLPEFVRRWRAGTQIVLGVREKEKSGALLTFFRGLSYRVQAAIGDYPIIPNATGFGIYDRRVVDSIRALNEPEPFFRGLLVETGYSIEQIPYKRPARAGGRSNNNFFSLLDFALNGLAGSSKKLLRAPLYVAFFVGLLTLVCLIGAVVAAFTGYSWQLWLFAAMLQGQFFLLFLFLGLLGVQTALVSERTRNQPLVIERERINFDQRG
ncbi:glycosyltransferase involved in cell wall biosynthesis [Novosphingobium kunmingense]|uniref:Glycosyltransferase involved in cell wall biosynthesis n=1 Tax=Novosphingobium kunmingense TaxID=1211806 RepID=A0A2N0H6F1_9SPHN|nr:glycosyltransferase family 2 protein [Novosphingobium kunmingense]PKB14531.1 glycosyltransferase involved in cell wall biosynthesis [Novosphingobium kunmingense]